MAERMTLEKILRDDNDDSGQSVRGWKIEQDGDFITLRPHTGSGFILIQSGDVEELVKDLRRMREMSF